MFHPYMTILRYIRRRNFFHSHHPPTAYGTIKKGETCFIIDNEVKRMKYDSAAKTTQPLEHLRKLHQ
jgi:hypothetical protein